MLTQIAFEVRGKDPDAVLDELDMWSTKLSRAIEGDWECVYDVVQKHKDKEWVGRRRFTPYINGGDKEPTQILRRAEPREEDWPFRGS